MSDHLVPFQNPPGPFGLPPFGLDFNPFPFSPSCLPPSFFRSRPPVVFPFSPPSFSSFTPRPPSFSFSSRLFLRIVACFDLPRSLLLLELLLRPSSSASSSSLSSEAPIVLLRKSQSHQTTLYPVILSQPKGGGRKVLEKAALTSPIFRDTRGLTFPGSFLSWPDHNDR